MPYGVQQARYQAKIAQAYVQALHQAIPLEGRDHYAPMVSQLIYWLRRMEASSAGYMEGSVKETEHA